MLTIHLYAYVIKQLEHEITTIFLDDHRGENKIFEPGKLYFAHAFNNYVTVASDIIY
jgi:hypothetical protein